jgi:predicted aspartyl protease
MLMGIVAVSATARAAEAITVPMQLHGVHIFLSIAINGKPATFVLDTGASANVITPQAVERLHLTPGTEQTPLTGAAAKVGSVPNVKIASVEIGAFRMQDQVAYVIPLPEALECDGLLGAPFFQQQIVTIDYEHFQLTITPRSSFKPPANGAVLGLHFIGNTPFIEADADGCKGSFRIDTGAGNGITLFGGFVDRSHMKGKYTPSIRLVTGRGVGGLLYGDLIRLPEFTIGPYHFAKPVTELSRQTAGTFGDKQNAGNVGGEVWQRFTITFDYARQKVYLVPNGNFDTPFITPRSGLAVDTEKGLNIVRDVTPNSPGTEAGIVPGDIVTAVDGVPIEQIKPFDFTAILRRDPGTKVRLRLRSADKTERETTLTLRDLL